MSKDQVIKKLLESGVEPGVKYHSPLPADIAPWYVYTRGSGHRVLCVPGDSLRENMTEDDYRDMLVSAPVKTVLRGYSVQHGFVLIDSPYDAETGFAAEAEDREFDRAIPNAGHKLSVGELYLPGTTSWPEAAEYNYFSSNHELRFFVKQPTRYVTEAISKMPVQLGLYTEDDIILLVYKFTDYRKHFVPVHGYSPFSIHLVPEDLRTLPLLPADPEHEEVLRIHLVDADTGILKAARAVLLSPEFSAALCSAIINQGAKSFAEDYSERLRVTDSRFPDSESLMNHCMVKCTG